MRLFEAIIAANHRAIQGDSSAGLRPDEFGDSLPLTALTCIDPRLNRLFPNVLGIEDHHFIWLRNAGNVITSPLSSTTRSLALACVVKGAREIAVIGHTDCQVRKTTMLQILDRFSALGIDRACLPDNLTEYFGLFASETQNVIKAVTFLRESPLIGKKAPIHGLMVDVQSGKLEWIVNGYQALSAVHAGGSPPAHAVSGADSIGDSASTLPGVLSGILDGAIEYAHNIKGISAHRGIPTAPPAPPAPPKIPPRPPK